MSFMPLIKRTGQQVSQRGHHHAEHEDHEQNVFPRERDAREAVPRQGGNQDDQHGGNQADQHAVQEIIRKMVGTPGFREIVQIEPLGKQDGRIRQRERLGSHGRGGHVEEGDQGRRHKGQQQQPGRRFFQRRNAFLKHLPAPPVN
jgi:hypothetical protein